MIKPAIDVGEYDYTRFAHSVGVYLLLRKYGAPIEEQIAGLIHDVSHSAFSHCIDYVLDSGSEKEHNHQDNQFDSFIRKTEIPEIIKKQGFDLEYILNDDNFLLEEKDLPDLCADRIDYSLRTAVIFEELGEIDKNFPLVFKHHMSSKEIGKLGEKIAENYLKKKGYQILEQNYRFRIPGNPQKGEIDIVAKKGDLIIFFEVKTLIKNSGERFSAISPEEKVNFSKSRKLARAAESWLMKNKIPLNSKWQIDVISIEVKNGEPQIEHFENAISDI